MCVCVGCMSLRLYVFTAEISVQWKFCVQGENKMLVKDTAWKLESGWTLVRHPRSEHHTQIITLCHLSRSELDSQFQSNWKNISLLNTSTGWRTANMNDHILWDLLLFIFNSVVYDTWSTQVHGAGEYNPCDECMLQPGGGVSRNISSMHLVRTQSWSSDKKWHDPMQSFVWTA